jgi:hypothetical protein
MKNKGKYWNRLLVKPMRKLTRRGFDSLLLHQLRKEIMFKLNVIDKLHSLEARKQRQMDLLDDILAEVLHDDILDEVEALLREDHLEHEKAVKIRNKIEAFFN